jgi:hypothetical protein
VDARDPVSKEREKRKGRKKKYKAYVGHMLS